MDITKVVQVGCDALASCAGADVAFDCIVTDVTSRTLALCGAAGRDLPSLTAGTLVRIKVSKSLLRGTVLFANAKEWMLSDVDGWDGKDRREFFRQSLDTPATAIRFGKDGKLEISTPIRLLDVSAVGVRFSAKYDENWSIGDKLQLDWNEGIPIEGAFRCICEIVRADRNFNGVFFGCKFLDIDPREQERLIRVIFQIQQLSRRSS